MFDAIKICCDRDAYVTETSQRPINHLFYVDDLALLELFFRYLLVRNALSCSRIDVVFITESTFRLQQRDDNENSGDSPRRTVTFSLRPAVVVVLKKPPCPENLKLIPQIRQKLSLDDSYDTESLSGCETWRAIRFKFSRQFEWKLTFVTRYKYHVMGRLLSHGACSTKPFSTHGGGLFSPVGEHQEGSLS